MADVSPEDRRGILAGGNFIIDHVKVIDAWPGQDMLANIVSESSGNGGGPYNVLKDLAALGVAFPLEAAGVVGNDAKGHWIFDDCAKHGIDASQLHRHDSAPTSYTDAMTVASTGRRTFFHQRGANAHFGASDIDFDGTTARLFHLGYLMLLDQLDELRTGGRTEAGDILASARAAGLTTSVDCVSAESEEFRKVALAAMPHADYFISNEAEAGRILGKELDPSDAKRLTEAAATLCEEGNCGAAIVHTEFGAVAVDKSTGTASTAAAIALPQSLIKGATGAGDAFAAGLLLGIHEREPMDRCLELGVAVAATCLREPTPSEGILPLAQCLELAVDFGRREFG